MVKLNKKVKNIIFVVEGGIGKNIMATSVIKAFKEKYFDKNIIVVASSQEIFLYNSNVKRIFSFNNPLYFYDDYVNEESVVFKYEPYLHYDYINKNKHLVECWGDYFDLEIKDIRPDLYFLKNEVESSAIYYDKITNNGQKELILLQWIGGIIPNSTDRMQLNSNLARMYRRSLERETAQKITDILIDKGYVVGVVQKENYPIIKNAININFPLRSTLVLLLNAKTFIGIDSFLQHAAASNFINKKGIVCWAGTSPKVLGYETHINLTKEVCPTPFCHRPNSYLFDVQPHGALWDCKYGEKCRKYSAEEIIKVFEENFENKKEEKK